MTQPPDDALNRRDFLRLGTAAVAAGSAALAGEAGAQPAGRAISRAWEACRLVKCLREGLPTDMNVYDAAALSAVVELSMQSTTRRAGAVDVPDFTRGRCRTHPRLDLVRG